MAYGVKKNWKPYHLWNKKPLRIEKYWIYGDSPSEIRKRLGGYNQKEKILVPSGIDTVSGIKSYQKKVGVSKKNLKLAKRRNKKK